MSLLGIIPARGNSKRLPRKNFLEINGKSLLERAIECAQGSGIFCEIVVSSEDLTAMDIAIPMGVTFRARSPILSLDGVETASIVFDTLVFTEYRCLEFCVLNPTTPTRGPEDLRRGYLYMQEREADFMMSGNRPIHDGAFLFGKTEAFVQSVGFWGAEWCRTSGHVDINTHEDFERAREILEKREADVAKDLRYRGSGLESRE